MLHHKAPHREWLPDEKNRALFASRTVPEPATLRDDYATRPAALPENRQTVFRDLTRGDLKLTPPEGLEASKRGAWLAHKPTEVEVTRNGVKTVLTGAELEAWKYQRYMQDYLACVQGVDDNIGRFLDWLKAEGLDRDTVVFYSSDNGFFLGDNGMYDKRFMYEPSLHIPLLAMGPGIQAGHVTEAFALNVDFAPTFLDLAGLPVPADMQGKSLAPVLAGKTPDDWRKSMYYRYYHDPGDHNTRAHYGVRTTTHKLIHYWKKDAWELFDLQSDPHELRNLYGQAGSEKITASLQSELKRLRTQLKDEDQFSTDVPKETSRGEPLRWAEGFSPQGPKVPRP
jgi:arylsulfatase A-like enzyme